MRVSLRLAAGTLMVLTVALAAAAQSPPPAGQLPPGQSAQAKPPAAAQGQKPPQVGKVVSEVRLVSVVFSVLDKHNHFVTDLGQNNFQVLDDDLPQQVEFFSRESDLPLRIGLLLDTSNSIRERLQFEQDAAFDFLYRVIRPGKDLAFLMTFDTHPQVQQGFTDNIEALRQAIYNQHAGGGTALYDAVYDASRDYLTNPPPAPAAGVDVRRVLVVISDGLDDLSDHARSEALEMAERAGVVIYSISTSNNWVSPDQQTTEGMPIKLHLSPGDEVLKQFSDDSGGRSFFPARVEDLSQAFVDIGLELRSQYSIAYTPSNHADDGKFHSIRVSIDRKDLKVRARKGYWSETLIALPAAHPGR
ncbi:MAG TPA: VWA domain-containing protein [Candidatus Acidoferrales bacterium]|nr:VWA domain-containing protein [Candidatus Acidoferrales bacterium]